MLRKGSPHSRPSSRRKEHRRRGIQREGEKARSRFGNQEESLCMVGAIQGLWRVPGVLEAVPNGPAGPPCMAGGLGGVLPLRPGERGQPCCLVVRNRKRAVSYTHLRAHETVLDLVCRLLLEKKKKN